MAPPLADRSTSLALAAAMSRHPAAGARGTTAAPSEAPSFATVAALLTGPWRINDPVAFASAMQSAPLVAGYPVVDLCACARRPTVGLDPLSAAVAGHLESAVGAAAERSALNVRWVAAVGGRYLFVEAAAQAPADEEGPELLLLAHLVEPAHAGHFGTGIEPFDDDSWLVVVVGNGRGGVAGIGRAPLPRDLESAFGPVSGPGGRSLRRRWSERAEQREPLPPTRLGLAVLRERLVRPARVAEGLETAGEDSANEAVLLPFRR